MSTDKQFWDKMSGKYQKMFGIYKPYDKMYEFARDSVSENMVVLEVGTGTGLVAREIADKVQSVEATDFSDQMIEQAKLIKHASNVNFSCADIFDLPFEDNRFDAVIASNILHIIPSPDKALAEIKRVLKPKGLLIAPTFLWKEISFLGKIQKFIMMRKNFPLQTEWSEQTFKDFINNNGYSVKNFKKIKASFAIGCVCAEVN